MPWHAPPEHWSPIVHGSPSEQPRVWFVWTQLTPLHRSSVQGLPSSHPVGTHAPPQHVVPVVHVVERMHVAPEQAAISHAPGVGWQFVMVHALVGWQPSAGSQRNPAPQITSSALCAHAPVASQLSAVHAIPSSHEGGGPETHTPPPQRSSRVHGFPSLQPAALGAETQARTGSHRSSVHGLPSSQTIGGLLALHAPAGSHCSPLVQTS